MLVSTSNLALVSEGFNTTLSIAVRTVFSCSLLATSTLKSRGVTSIVNVALTVEFPLIVGLVAVNVAV